jgi:hypothetical protein
MIQFISCEDLKWISLLLSLLYVGVCKDPYAYKHVYLIKGRKKQETREKKRRTERKTHSRKRTKNDYISVFLESRHNDSRLSRMSMTQGMKEKGTNNDGEASWREP